MNSTRTMTAQEYLAQTQDLDKRINNKLDQLMKLRASATMATATIADMPKADSPPLQSMENVVVKIMDLNTAITADIDALVERKQEITTLFKLIPTIEDQLIMEQRYLCSKTWAQVADFLEYDGRYIRKLRVRATQAFVKIFAEHMQKTLYDTMHL